MELKRPFGIERLLAPATAREIFDRCNERLREDDFTTMGLLKSWKVAVVCTTDDPVDSLEAHRTLAARKDPATRVYPTWRPDAALAVDDPAAWNAWVGRLEAAANRTVAHVRRPRAGPRRAPPRLPRARLPRLRSRPRGACRRPPPTPTREVARDVRRAARGPRARRAAPRWRCKPALLHRLALMDHERGWVQQFHLGA